LMLRVGDGFLHNCACFLLASWMNYCTVSNSKIAMVISFCCCLFQNGWSGTFSHLYIMHFNAFQVILCLTHAI
jgi:hypothetical protein